MPSVGLGDLKALCDQWVPISSRHDRSFDGPEWWPAHEIGHLLMAKPHEIGRPNFGLEIDSSLMLEEIPTIRHRYLLKLECAAMTISAKLLCAAGHGELAESESEDTDYDTMLWWYDHAAYVARYVKSRCPRVPTTRSRLESLLRRRVSLVA